MTLTLTAYDLSQEAKDFKERVAKLQGLPKPRIASLKYHPDNSTATYTAYVPEQPELLNYETKPHRKSPNSRQSKEGFLRQEPKCPTLQNTLRNQLDSPRPLD